MEGEAGFQAEVLRGGMHFGLWRWQYRIHKLPLVTVPQGKIGYIYARRRRAAACSRPDALGQVIPCNHFQDAHADSSGARRRAWTPSRIVGRRRRTSSVAILREGVYAINLSLFMVICEDMVYRLEAGGSKELKALVNWQNELSEVDGFQSGQY